MRTIQKQISLEPMTSRLPSVWPSYYNNEPNIFYFDDDSLKMREYEHTSNWGMVPLNIAVSPMPNNTTYASGYNIGCEFVLSFDRLSDWYYFFTEYYNLLKQYSHCNRVYTSAEDYYNYESLTKYADQMKYGTDKQVYLNLDKEFANKGGIVEVKTFDKDTSEYESMTPSEAHDEKIGDRMAMVDVYDIGFFKWICENVVPSFVIPMKYRNYWKRDKLFYPDVIKWIAWFEPRLDYERKANYTEGHNGEVDLWDCKQESVDDCCDCEEYFNRGGERIYDLLVEWYNSVQENIQKLKQLDDFDCAKPSIILPTNLQVSIDDLGEFSIFSKEYELGVDYRTAESMTATANTKQGTVVTMDGKSLILTEGSGYTFNAEYMEKYASSCETCGYEGVFYGTCPKCGAKDIVPIGWEDYTEHYIRNNHNEFYVTNITYFSFDENDVKYVTNASSLDDAMADLKNQMSKKYPLTKRDNGWILINGELYPINEIEYATYDKTNEYLGNKRYMVFRENITNVPYTYLNGSKIYSEFYSPKNLFYFPFFKKDDVLSDGKVFNINDYITFERNNLGSTMYYIYYNDNAYEIPSDAVSITIDDIEFYRISGYSIDNEGETLYLTYENIIISGDNQIEISDAHIIDGDKIMVDYPFEIKLYVVDEINGRTISKLKDLRLFKVLTDDIGNNIDGIYEIDSTKYNFQPNEGDILELIYQVGNTANISRFSRTVQNSDEIENDENYFVGDIIKEMKFYYKEYGDTIPQSTIFDVVLEDDDEYTVTINGEPTDEKYASLRAILNSTEAKEILENDENESHIFYDDIFCDVTYYIGATLKRKKGQNYNLSYDDKINNHGVEYKETVRFVKENREYYLKKASNAKKIIPTRVNNIELHSISYPIYVYKLTQDLEYVYDSQYDATYEVPMADFKFNINLFTNDTDTFAIKYSKDMEKHNGLQVMPIFREEYRFGSSMIENVDSNIYIDRGINAAFERHLKLGEVTSLEALEQYGLNFFKIIES